MLLIALPTRLARLYVAITAVTKGRRSADCGVRKNAWIWSGLEATTAATSFGRSLRPNPALEVRRLPDNGELTLPHSKDSSDFTSRLSAFWRKSLNTALVVTFLAEIKMTFAT